jgi:hypothetical protein
LLHCGVAPNCVLRATFAPPKAGNGLRGIAEGQRKALLINTKMAARSGVTVLPFADLPAVQVGL